MFVGPSGCGKSTLLRMIAGLEDISDGEISIGGTVVNDLPPRDRDIAMVFQDYALYPHKTVCENMAFGLRLRKRRRRPRSQSASREAADDPADRRTCSSASRGSCPADSGSASRWAARSCASRRSSCSTSRSRTSTRCCAAEMRVEIKKLHQRFGTTIVYVTHDQVEAMTLADRIVGAAGRATSSKYDTPDGIYNRPRRAVRRGLHRAAADEFPAQVPRRR